MDQFLSHLQIHFLPWHYAVISLATLLAATIDVRTYTIRNTLTLPLVATGIVFNALAPAGEGVMFALGGTVCGFLILLPVYLAGGVGAGDIKLLAGIGAWVGPHDVLSVFIVTGLLTGIYALGAAIFLRHAGNTATVGGETGSHLRARRFRLFPAERIDAVTEMDRQTKRRRLIPLAAVIAAALAVLLVVRLVSANG
jgi:prepilin peptidase CpaA